MTNKHVNLAEAKTHFSSLVDRAAAGEEIILSKAGRPVARLMPLAERTPRQPGLLHGWAIPDDLFLEPENEEDLAAAEGKHTDVFGVSRRGRG